MSSTQKKNKQINLPLTEFLINEVYRISKPAYIEIIRSFQKNYFYFAEPGETEILAKSPGKIFRERFLPESDIYSAGENNRKNLSNIKSKFLNKYLALIGVPYPAKKSLKTEEVIQTEKPFLLEERVFYSPEFLKTFIRMAPEFIESGKGLVWLSSEDLNKGESLVNIVSQKLLLVDNALESPLKKQSHILKYLKLKNLTLVFDYTNAAEPGIEEIKFIRKLITLKNETNHFRLFIITQNPGLFEFPENSVYSFPDKLKQVWKPDKSERDAANNRFLIKFTVLLILLIPGSIYLYSIASKPQAVVKMFYFGDLPVRDSFKAGVQFIWLDSNQNTVHYGAGTYFASHKLEYIPENAIYFVPVSGGYKSMPEKIHISILERPEISLNFYRKLTFNDTFTEQILNPSAQRWYVFKLEKPSNVLFRVKAITPNFSPQIAIFRDPNGLKRVTGSSNFSGKSSVDSTYGYLDPGEYYLKVRGYDSLTGKFTVEGLILKE